MSENEFDKWIYDKIHDHSSLVPGDMWNRINAEKTERRGIGWIKTGGGILLLLIAISLGLFILNEPTESKVSTPLTDRRKQLAFSSTENRGGLIAKTRKLNTQVPTSNGAVLNTPISSSLNTRMPGSANTNRNVTQNIHQFASIKKLNKAVKTVGLRPEAKKYHEVNPTENLALSGPTFSKNITLLRSEPAITKENLQLLQASGKLRDNLKQYALSCFVDCPTSKQRNTRVFLELYASPDYARKTILATNMPAEFLARKDSSENFSSAFTAGFRITKSIGENMVLKTGLQYAQINEKFQFRRENERRQTTVITIRSIIRSPGDTILVRDTSTIEQIGYLVTTSMNKYRSIDLPLIVGYEWGNTRLRVALNAGLLLNLSSWQTGQMLDSSYNAVPINKSTGGQVFKKNLGVGLYAGASVMTSVSNNVQLFAEPWFRYNISKMTRPQNPFSQKYKVAGLSLGIRYQLSGSRRKF